MRKYLFTFCVRCQRKADPKTCRGHQVFDIWLPVLPDVAPKQGAGSGVPAMGASGNVTSPGGRP